MACFVGLMSGTSLDGVDGVVATFDAEGRWQQVLGHARAGFPVELHRELLALQQPGDNELHRAALAANALSEVYARLVASLLRQAGLAAGKISAIGAHGQTVRHRPREFDATGYTLQLLNGALLAQRCGIDVVCDFRSADIAAGGEGAPLVPAFHAACFGRPGVQRALLNVGGIANLSLLDGAGGVRGFDCGPGNVLMDAWCQRQRGKAYDENGAWAATGRIVPALLATLLDEPYFRRSPPKSTGRDLFHAEWLDSHLDPAAWASLDAADVMATLTELTAVTVADALKREAPDTAELFVCGGGAFNHDLLSRLRARLGANVRVESTAAIGMPPEQMEALAFAWLAAARLGGRPANLPAVTGAKTSQVLGALYCH
jgi:anhydro-N-acetylmuramic acid kinase